MPLYCVVIFKTTNGVTVVPDTWMVGGNKVLWPKCAPERRHRLCVGGLKFDGPCDEYDAVIYGVYNSYCLAQSNVAKALADTDGASSDATLALAFRPKRKTKKPKRLAESTSDLSSNDDSSCEDIVLPVKRNKSSTPCPVIEVDIPPNPLPQFISSPLMSPNLGPPNLHSTLLGHVPTSNLVPHSSNLFLDENTPPNRPSLAVITSQPQISCFPSTSGVGDQNVLFRMEAKMDNISRRLDAHYALLKSQAEKSAQQTDLLQHISRQLVQMSSIRLIRDVNQPSSSAVCTGSPSDAKLPSSLSSADDFDDMEKFLSVENQRQLFEQCMSKLGGSSAGELMRNILTRTIALPYASEVNLTGLNNKRAMKGSKFFEAIKAAIRKVVAFSNSTDLELNTAAREWLHNCRQRKQLQVRRSYNKNDIDNIADTLIVHLSP